MHGIFYQRFYSNLECIKNQSCELNNYCCNLLQMNITKTKRCYTLRSVCYMLHATITIWILTYQFQSISSEQSRVIVVCSLLIWYFGKTKFAIHHTLSSLHYCASFKEKRSILTDPNYIE